MRCRRLVATLLIAGATAFAWAADAPRVNVPAAAPQGEPVVDGVLEDSEFGVRTRYFGLDRKVEMYQWQSDGRGGHQQVWKPALVDSSTFPPEHANPPTFPLESRIWWARQVTLDGKPVDLQVLKTLGSWQDFRPGFTRLPANLAATFQPEGDGLGSSLNPLDPRTGDLRIRWRALHLPALAGKVELRDGKWHLKAPVRNAIAAPTPATVTEAPVEESPLQVRGEVRLLGKIALGGLLGIALLLVWVRRVRRKRHAK